MFNNLADNYLNELRKQATEVKSPKLTEQEQDALWARQQQDIAVHQMVEQMKDDLNRPAPEEPQPILGLSELLPEKQPVNLNVKIQLTDGQMPTQATPGSAGWDLYAAEDAVILTGNKPLPVSVGFKISMPKDVEMQIRSRSGLSLKGVVVANAPGTVDSDFRGVVKVILTGTVGLLYPFEIKKGDRIAQAVFAWVPQLSLSQVETLDDTSRGEGGFGSTGK